MNYNMRQYSKEVEKLIITEPKNRLIENVLGLGEEAGEVQGKVKKLVRDKTFSKSVSDIKGVPAPLLRGAAPPLKGGRPPL